MQLLEVVGERRVKILLAVGFALTCGFASSSKAPPHTQVVVTDTQTTILDVVEFAPGTAKLQPTSGPILDAVAETLLGNPSIERVEVQAHTSGRGNAGANQALSDQRAATVKAYLVRAGVPPTRLVAQGYGDTQPIDRAVPSKNERISFLILR
jgi:outer membrane protein OmpA-like peptidoglycan-associated protein